MKYVKSGEIVSEKEPFKQTSYVDGASGILYRLHFGDFGGVGLRMVYFILGIVSCFVILSGVLIWLVARDKKNVEEKKRKFNDWLGWVYLAI
ncbi:PepSY domain-containing protein [Catalinimonas locisalis]